MITIPFHTPSLTGKESFYVQQAIANIQTNDASYFIKQCSEWLSNYTQSLKVLLTPSCTAALEMSALLCNLQVGDEVIMPSYTFPSTANAIVLRGATPVFVDIRADTLNIDETLISNAITANTRAIIVVHYAGVACEMDTIMAIAARHNLFVIEDAAHAIGAFYKGKPLGTIGHLGTYSFHSTKNIQCGEGGALLINHHAFLERAYIIQEKGTNRHQFIHGDIEFYRWVDVGSSFLMNEITAAFLWAQLEELTSITQQRQQIWHNLHNALAEHCQTLKFSLPTIPDSCEHNGHIFYILCHSHALRKQLALNFKKHLIYTTTHYEPLHNSPAALKFTPDIKKLAVTEDIAERILRLPLSPILNADRLIRAITIDL